MHLISDPSSLQSSKLYPLELRRRHIISNHLHLYLGPIPDISAYDETHADVLQYSINGHIDAARTNVRLCP